MCAGAGLDRGAHLGTVEQPGVARALGPSAWALGGLGALGLQTRRRIRLQTRVRTRLLHLSSRSAVRRHARRHVCRMHVHPFMQAGALLRVFGCTDFPRAAIGALLAAAHKVLAGAACGRLATAGHLMLTGPLGRHRQALTLGSRIETDGRGGLRWPRCPPAPARRPRRRSVAPVILVALLGLGVLLFLLRVAAVVVQRIRIHLAVPHGGHRLDRLPAQLPPLLASTALHPERAAAAAAAAAATTTGACAATAAGARRDAQ